VTAVVRRDWIGLDSSWGRTRTHGFRKGSKKWQSSC